MDYVIIGEGRVGAAFAGYCRHLGHEAQAWPRSAVEESPDKLASLIGQAKVLAIATPDTAIEPVWRRFRAEFNGAYAIHFSGALTIAGLRSCHPLFSFPKTTLAPEVFATVAFAIEEDAPPFAEIVPGAENPTFVVHAADRAYYHALAVISGNYAAHIWNEAAARFERRFAGGAGEVFGPYFQSVVDRFREMPLSSLTGPVARKDAATVQANLAALEDEPELEALYREFLEKAWPGYR